MVLLPVYLAFFLHYLVDWAPFGACRGCLPLCRSQLVPRAQPPEAAAGLFNLGILAVSMRLRMFPRRMWRRPPLGLFLVYKVRAPPTQQQEKQKQTRTGVERTYLVSTP